MTKEQAIKHLKLMQSGARNAIRFKKNDKKISEEERKEDIEIYQDQLEALKIATKALEQPTSDDCVSRQAMLDAITEIDGNINMDIYTDEVREIVKELPPVTPTHGTCKDCKHWKDSDGVYRRGVGAESKCPINNSRVFEGTFYCADFEKRGGKNE